MTLPPKAPPRQIPIGIPPSQPDSFQLFSKDPRLIHEPSHTNTADELSIDSQILVKQAKSLTEKSAQIDLLKTYKIDELNQIAHLEDEPFTNRELILEKTTKIFETIIAAAAALVRSEMELEFGQPSYLNAYKQIDPVSHAIVACGDFGAREVNEHSNLNLFFIYSHIGKTSGAKSVANQEYFAEFANRLKTLSGQDHLNLIAVKSYDHFLDQQTNHSSAEEHLALMNNRLIAGPKNFQDFIKANFATLIFRRDLSLIFWQKLSRNQMRKNTTSNSREFDFKNDPGGLSEIELALHGLQLKNQIVFPELKNPSTIPLLKALATRRILSSENANAIQMAWIFFRTLQAHLQRHTSQNLTKFIFDSAEWQKMAVELEAKSGGRLEDLLASHKKTVRALYDSVYK